MAGQWLGKITSCVRCDKAMCQFGESKNDKEDLIKHLEKGRQGGKTSLDQTKSPINNTLQSLKSKDPGAVDKNVAKQGCLYLMEETALGSIWVKYYCMYEKTNRKLTMIPCKQTSGKITATGDKLLKSCTRRVSDFIDMNLCFNLNCKKIPGHVYTLQALSEEDRRLWLKAVNGCEPTYGPFENILNPEDTILDDVGINFVKHCFDELETRGLRELGIYRKVGCAFNVTKLLQQGLDPQKKEKLVLSDRCQWDTKTITSAVLAYFRYLPEPVLTFSLYDAFIDAARQEMVVRRVAGIHTVLYQLPPANFRILEILVCHLQDVVARSDRNKTTVRDIGVSFGRILLRAEKETPADINNIKYSNRVVEILVENAETIFDRKPDMWIRAKRCSYRLQQVLCKHCALCPNCKCEVDCNGFDVIGK